MEKGNGLYIRCKANNEQVVGELPPEQLISACGKGWGEKEVERLMEQLKNDAKTVQLMLGNLFKVEYVLEPVVIMKEKEYNDLMNIKEGK